MSDNPLNGGFFFVLELSVESSTHSTTIPPVRPVLHLSIRLSIPLPIHSLTRPLVHPRKHQLSFVTTAPFDSPTRLYRCLSCAARYLWLCSSPGPLYPSPLPNHRVPVNERTFPLGNARTKPSCITLCHIDPPRLTCEFLSVVFYVK